MAREIILTQGFVAIVDDEDYEKINSVNWCYSHGYAYRKKDGRTCYMHKEILNASMVDHINGNKLDNRKANLRLTDKSLNALNRNVSGFTILPTGKFRAQLKIRGNYINKVFNTQADAVSWREQKKKEYGAA